MRRMRNPRRAPLAWYQDAWEQQQAILGPDPWQYGSTEAHRKNLETLVGYSYEQGLISRRVPLEDLFLSVSEGRKRGVFRTYLTGSVLVLLPYAHAHVLLNLFRLW